MKRSFIGSKETAYDESAVGLENILHPGTVR